MLKGHPFLEILRDLEETERSEAPSLQNTIWCLRVIGATISDAHLFAMKDVNYNADSVNQIWDNYQEDKGRWRPLHLHTIYSWLKDDMKDRPSDLEKLCQKYPFLCSIPDDVGGRMMAELQPGCIEKCLHLLAFERTFKPEKRTSVLECLRSLEVDSEIVHKFCNLEGYNDYEYEYEYDYDQIETEFQNAGLRPDYLSKNYSVNTLFDWLAEDLETGDFERFCEEFLLSPLTERQKLLFGSDDDLCQILFDVVGDGMIFVRTCGCGFYWDKNTKLYKNCDHQTMAIKAGDYLQKESDELENFLIAQYREIEKRIRPQPKVLQKILRKKINQIQRISKFVGSFNGPLKIIRKCRRHPFFQQDFKAKIGAQHLLFPIADGQIFDIRLMRVRERVQSDIFEFASTVHFNPTQENFKIANQYFLELANDDQELADYIRLFLGSCIIGIRPSDKGHLFILWGKNRNAKFDLMDIMKSIMGRFFTVLSADAFYGKNRQTKDPVPKSFHRMAVYEHRNRSAAPSRRSDSEYGLKLNLTRIEFQAHATLVMTTNHKPPRHLATRSAISLVPFLSQKNIHQFKTEDLDAIATSILLAAGEFLNRRCQMPEMPCPFASS